MGGQEERRGEPERARSHLFNERNLADVEDGRDDLLVARPVFFAHANLKARVVVRVVPSDQDYNPPMW